MKKIIAAILILIGIGAFFASNRQTKPQAEAPIENKKIISGSFDTKKFKSDEEGKKILTPSSLISLEKKELKFHLLVHC